MPWSVDHTKRSAAHFPETLGLGAGIHPVSQFGSLDRWKLLTQLFEFVPTEEERRSLTEFGVTLLSRPRITRLRLSLSRIAGARQSRPAARQAARTGLGWRLEKGIVSQRE